MARVRFIYISGSTATTVPAKKANKAKNVAAPARSIKDQLVATFVEFNPSKPGRTGLLSDWETYELSLPIRKHRGEWLKLHTLPYWGSDEELLSMVNMLGDKGRYDRDEPVKYVCAPSEFGKTTSIVPAFLKSNVFTHYLCLAFYNNGDRSFKLRPSKPDEGEDVAEEQGAAFAVECVRILLEVPDREGLYEVPRNDDPPSINESQKALFDMLEKHLGTDCKVLIHVDEHRKMCARNRSPDAADPGTRFSRGAMQCLNAASATVVATFTEPPPLEPVGSSAVCRCPVALPRVDINKVMGYLANQIGAGCCGKVTACLRRPITNRDAGRFSFPSLPDEATQLQRRLMATLRLRFAMSLDTAKALGALHRPGSGGPVDMFVAAVAGAIPALHDDMSEAALTKAITACTIELPRKPERTVENAHAANLLDV